MYKKIILPIFFIFSPESIHRIVFFIIKVSFKFSFIRYIFKKRYLSENYNSESEVFGLKFKNKVGLAAGFDKDAELFEELSLLGFGFIEVGTITPRPQKGNDKPRIFRLKKDKGIINRMGFNNKGIENAIKRLKKRNNNIIIGGNIGKNKDTPNEEAVNDYILAFKSLEDVVDYFTINISSPNTPNLRLLQDKEPLKKILTSLQEINIKKRPILLKISPDLTKEQLDDIVEIVTDTKISGIIATNTTISRDSLKEDKDVIDEIGPGGLSGIPLRDRSTEVIKYLHSKSDNRFYIIGVGGIHSPKDALEKIKAGASLVQIYTGLIYNGISLVKEIKKEIHKNRL
ncbi:quinone-dependent dihydroorotate dehydrogenase [Ichthyobacterium seriolicida]|uniref:quinone-dependent dihydroorotate dehydrogenase n=1 Tax=Ichthyobacterium seriolicida TaxID=242600 RepID=UPI000BBCE26A|nr:quinone-dependent dihydroorotate dehydrogenase [Ichthyobacterium seriolicida]